MGFKDTLSAAGRAFLIAFGASVLALSTGILAAPNQDAMLALAVASLLPASTTMVSSAQVTDSRQARIFASSFLVMMMTESLYIATEIVASGLGVGEASAQRPEHT